MEKGKGNNAEGRHILLWSGDGGGDKGKGPQLAAPSPSPFPYRWEWQGEPQCQDEKDLVKSSHTLGTPSTNRAPVPLTN